MNQNCRECGSIGSVIFDHNQGDVICTRCGSVLEENYIDDTPEWTAYEDDGDSNSRAYVQNKYQPSTLAIVGTTREAKSLAAIQRKIMETDPKLDGIKLIEELCSKLELPNNTIEAARDIYFTYEEEKKKKTNQKTKSKKKSKDFALAIIFTACNKTGSGLTMKEIASSQEIDEKIIRKHCKEIANVIPSIGQIMTPAKFISKFVNDLNLPRPVEYFAQKIAEKGVNLMEGKRTSTTASSALLLALEVLGLTNVSSSDIARVAKIAENTLKSSTKILRENKSQLYSNEDYLNTKSQLK